MARAAIGAMCSRKSLKVSPDRLAMMMLGGSPIKVAAPPMFDARTSAIRNGAGLDGEPVADQQGDRRDQQHRGDVVQERRGHRGDQHQQHHHPERRALGPLGRPDRDVLEHPGPAQHARR